MRSDGLIPCDKCGVLVYERNLEVIGNNKWICPSCQGSYTDEELNEYWTIEEQDELHRANYGG